MVGGCKYLFIKNKHSTKSIILKNISFEVRSGVFVFKNLSVTFGGEKTGLVGKNGVGKTTLIKLITKELKPTSGTVEKQFHIAYLPQDYQIDLNLSVGQTLKTEKEHETLKALARVGLKGVALDRPMNTLSGGERMKVVLAGLLIQPADFLILDEPTNNLSLIHI